MSPPDLTGPFAGERHGVAGRKDVSMKLDRNMTAPVAAISALLLLAVVSGGAAHAATGAGGPGPAWLPRYDVLIDLDLARHRAEVVLYATWTNPQPAPTRELVFNAHSRYV